MAHVRKGQLTPSPQWARHLRRYWRRVFWKGERKAQQRDVTERVIDHKNPPYPYAPEDR